MLAVTRVSPAATTPARRASAGEGSGFSIADDAPGTPSAAAAAAGFAPGALASLLAMQEAGPSAATTVAGGVRDREARRHGRAVLDALLAWQRGLLRGEPEVGALRQLASIAGEAEAEAAGASDPGLRAVLAEIMLRARVELARYGIV